TPTSTSTATATATNTPGPQAPAVSVISKCAEPNLTSTVCDVPFGNTLSVDNNQNINYIVTITNLGGATSNIAASDPLALTVGQSFLGCMPAPGCTYDSVLNMVFFNTGPIAAGASISFYVRVELSMGPQTVYNTATIANGPSSSTTTVIVNGPGNPNLTPVIPVVVVNTAVPTNTPVPPTAVPPTNTPVPPTAVPPTNTPVPPTSTPVPPTSTPVPPTNTPVPPVPTNTPKPPKKPTATPVPTATTAPAPPVVVAAPPASTPPATLPVTGFGGARAVGHNVAVGQVYRAAHGNVTLGITGQPQAGGGSSPLTPILPVILGAIVVALGVLTRRFAFAKH
ncbi:MAG TPA: hypothetical protein VIO57_08775, partial [Chloroflexota bacterium]